MSSDSDEDFVDLTQEDDDERPKAKPKPAKKPAAPKAKAPPKKKAAPKAPKDDDDDEPKKAPAKPKPKPRPKKPTGPRGDMPVVLTAGAGRDGKRTLMVELDNKAGGFGVDTGAIGRASFPRVEGKRKFRLDLRGQEYDATIRPCATMLVLNVAGAEARVETVISEYATIKHTHDATTAYDQDFGTYAGDANVNARRRRGDSDGSDSDAAPQKKKPKKKPAARKRKPAARKKK
jgi:hypothetical protein